MKIERVWSMPNKWTFTIKPIKRLLLEEVDEGLWCDPFAGENSPAQITNDLNPERKATHNMDALEFLKTMETDSFDGVLYDPPYSPRQAAECYKGYGAELLKVKPTMANYWSSCKDEIARILKPSGKVICFGWNSMGIGKTRGFDMTRILMVPHGGCRNDTICTVEIRKPSLF